MGRGEAQSDVVIGIDALYLKPGEVGGSETYVRGLVPALAALAPDEPHLLFVPREAWDAFAGVPSNVRVVRCPVSARSRPARILYEQLRLPALATRLGVEVLLGAGFTSPALGRFARVTAVYDLQHVRHPEHFFPSHALAWRALVWIAVRRSRLVLTFSEASRADIARHYRIDPSAVRAIPLAPPPADRLPSVGEAEIEEVLRRHRIGRPFLLAVSTTHPHKGLGDLLEAFARLAREPGFPHRLVLAGPHGFAHERLLALARALGLEGRASFVGWLPWPDLAALYRGADLLVYPSSFEGFGLPVLEAMAAGIPVVASRIPALVEIGADACEWVEPGDPEALAEAIRRVASDASLRARLATAGLARARAYSWERTARETRDALVYAAKTRESGTARRRSPTGNTWSPS